MNEIIVGKNITTSYGDKIMHDNVSWSVKEAEIYGFLGGSGAGKTTLMKTMIYLKKPSKGDIFFDGVNMWKSSQQEQQEIKLKSGTMFQFGALYSSMTTVTPMLSRSSFISASIWRELTGSRPLFGSSKNSTLGLSTKALASAARFFIPPLSSLG